MPHIYTDTKQPSPFPTMEEVEAASRIDLCRWWRFLPSAMTDEERVIQDRIHVRCREAGGFTPEISKAIGFTWGGDMAQRDYAQDEVRVVARYFHTLLELEHELKPSWCVWREWLWKHRSCLTPDNEDSVRNALRGHLPDHCTKEDLEALIREEQHRDNPPPQP